MVELLFDGRLGVGELMVELLFGGSLLPRVATLSRG